MPNFGARRGKVGKTNVKLVFSIFYAFLFDFFNFEPRVIFFGFRWISISFRAKS